ncbi:hypothetical protein F7725_004975 [Dissostichus mawsoni]|uniref:Uncharacterized protein n=1 Tax=Dissostichus mawsoni TaxID=36200 RepID=A0A7J5XKM7_DISMA|nr:hypothetical protein F7725_004975 [Dissostichus mawsoni]
MNHFDISHGRNVSPEVLYSFGEEENSFVLTFDTKAAGTRSLMKELETELRSVCCWGFWNVVVYRVAIIKSSRNHDVSSSATNASAENQISFTATAFQESDIGSG